MLMMSSTTKLIRVDTHTHTCASPDSLTKPAELIKAAHKAGLDRVAVTDHNAVAGALEAYALDPQMVIIGEEVKTSKGELLALFVKELVPPHLSPLETIRLLKQQDAFISVSHPFDPMRSGWSVDDLLEIAPHVDALEVFNAHCFTRKMNEQAEQFAREQNLPGTAGSDAHWAAEVGGGVLRLPPFDSAEGLRQVIHRARVESKNPVRRYRMLFWYVRLRKLFEKR
jgi:predicted metal-dependent phosphoesterase TrpH